MKIQVYMHYLKIQQFMNYEPVVVKTSFSGVNDIEFIIDLSKVFLVKQNDGIIIRRKHWYELLMFWKKSI